MRRRAAAEGECHTRARWPTAASVLVAVALLGSGCAPPLATVPPPGVECTLPYTQVGAIQGAGMVTPLAGQTVTTQGVVVADFEGPAPALRGFYLQDLRGDGDPATSDGIFIFNGDRDDVAVGDVVRVTGVAGEAGEQTQLTVASLVACGTTAAVAPTPIMLPVSSGAYLERYEGMLVRLPQTLYVTEHYQLGRFGEVVVSAGDRLWQPTAVAEPGAAALAVQAANDLNRMIVADASYAQNPGTIFFARGAGPLSAGNTLRGGDHVTGLVGVLTQTSAAGTGSGVAYRVRPLHTLGGGVPEFAAGNPRAAVPPAVGGTLRVASFNLLNYFNSFGGCTGGVGGAAVDCRGARDEAEFERQWRKTVAAIVAMDADIIGIVEIENDGYGPTSAIAHLVARLNTATGAGNYAFIDADARARELNALGTDAIKVGLLYRPARVTPAGRTAVLNSARFVTGGESAERNRPALAQAFAHAEGGTLVVSINHLKSKGSACDVPDAGDGQGNCNAARTVAARELAAWLAGDPTGARTADILIIGDLNAYAREDPVTALTTAGYVDLKAARHGSRAYTYVFNGQWGSLDYALASTSLAPKVTGVEAWHINADEPPVLEYGTRFKSPAQVELLYRADPFRSSDHDPVIVGLRLGASRD
jgi:uncharacterized protein